MYRKLVTGSLMAIALSASALTYAENDLMVRNHTACASTTITNSGPCSTILGKDIGITQPHSDHSIPAVWVSRACLFNKEKCKADVYMTDSCGGTRIATIIFNVQTGIIETSPNDNPSHFTVVKNGPFDVSLEGGPANSADCGK